MSTANLPAKRTPPQGGTLATIVEGARDRLSAVLSSHLTPERLTQLLYVLAPKTEHLAECVPETIVTSLIQVGTLDLDLTPGRNEAFLIPRWNKDTRQYECTFMPGYKGLEKLAIRTGVVTYIEPCEVCEGDTFDVTRTNEGTLIVHKPAYQSGRGTITHLYTMAHMFDGKVTVEVMTAEACEEIHQRSDVAKKAKEKGWEERGPWVTDWKEMALKTVLKRHCKRFPRRSDPVSEKAYQQLQVAIDADNREYQTALEAPAKPNNQSGFGQGMYASPEQSAAFEIKLKGFLAEINDRWLNSLSEVCRGDIPKSVRELNEYQADGHLLKWAVETGRLDRAIVPEDAKIRQRYRYTAVVYHRSKADQGALGRELRAYAEQHWLRQIEALGRDRPELLPELAERFGIDGPTTTSTPDDDPDPEFDEPGSNG